MYARQKYRRVCSGRRYLKLERVGAPYCLQVAAHGLSRLGQAAKADAFHDDQLLEAQQALLDKTIVSLSADARQTERRDTHVLRYANVRLSADVDVDDLWLALRADDLGCPTSLRQWALQG